MKDWARPPQDFCIDRPGSVLVDYFFHYEVFQDINFLALKPQINEPLCSNKVIGTPAVDGWAVTFGTARRGLGGLGPTQSPSRCTKCNSPPINGQCTNFILCTIIAFAV